MKSLNAALNMELKTPYPVEPTITPKPSHVLIHGLDEPGKIWQDLKLLRNQGINYQLFIYPNDQGIVDSARFFVDELDQCHNKGSHPSLSLVTVWATFVSQRS